MTQLPLPGFDTLEDRLVGARRRRLPVSRSADLHADDLVQAYLKRLAAHGAAANGVAAYRYQLRATLRAARRISGWPLTAVDLFREVDLLGHALVDDESFDGDPLSRWTLAQRRSTIRSFAALMRPELLAALGEEPHQVVDRALRSVAERVGGGYRLGGGIPRGRGGIAPTEEEVAALLNAVSRASGFEGLRNRAFFGILAATGSRVNALRLLDGADCVTMPNGRLRLYLHEKGKAERREVEVGADAAINLHDYVQAFNRYAAARGVRARARLGEPGAVWRNSAGQRWGYASVADTLRAGCAGSGVPPCTPHALRRAFASDAASRLPRHVVAQAGGWKGLERLDDHYVRPREPTIWEKLSRDAQQSTASEVGATDAATVAL